MVDANRKAGESGLLVPDLTGALLCGGRSSRMGTNKALLQMRPGVSQLDYALNLLAGLCPRVIACTGPSGRWPLELPPGIVGISDADETTGPLAGVIAALGAANGQAILLIACDMPWVDAAVLTRLVASRNTAAQATVFAASDGKPEPMCAVYEATALEPLRQHARRGRSGLRDFMRQVPIEVVPMDDPQVLASVNDAHELDEVHRFFSVCG